MSNLCALPYIFSQNDIYKLYHSSMFWASVIQQTKKGGVSEFERIWANILAVHFKYTSAQRNKLIVAYTNENISAACCVFSGQTMSKSLVEKKNQGELLILACINNVHFDYHNTWA